MGSGAVKLDTRVWDKLLKQCKEMDGSYVSVGIQGPQAAEKHEDAALTMVQIAAVHEFNGPADRPPGRAFIRPPYDNDPDKWIQRIRKACTEVLKGKNAIAELRKVGEEYRRLVIERMKAGIPPQLSLSTLMRRNAKHGGTKGRPSGYQQKAEKEAATGKPAVDDTPLIDTGAMMGAISVVVKKK